MYADTARTRRPLSTPSAPSTSPVRPAVPAAQTAQLATQVPVRTPRRHLISRGSQPQCRRVTMTGFRGLPHSHAAVSRCLARSRRDLRNHWPSHAEFQQDFVPTGCCTKGVHAAG
jgi:hypothetical protein